MERNIFWEVIFGAISKETREVTLSYKMMKPKICMKGQYAVIAEALTRITAYVLGDFFCAFCRCLKVATINGDNIFEKVQEIVCEQLGVETEKVTPEANFASDLGADSLDTVELVMALEEEFDIEIPDEAAESIGTVQAAVDYIKEKSAS